MEPALMMETQATIVSNELEHRELVPEEIDTVQGGFVCGGLCVAGAFVAGAAIGGGATWWLLSD